MAKLIDYVAKLRKQQPGWEVPDFDPASGVLKPMAPFSGGSFAGEGKTRD